MKVGIIISLDTEYESMWINGIKLNALNLSKTLNQIDGLEVYILDAGSKVSDLTKVSWDHTKYKVAKFIDMQYDVDLLFMLGASLPDTRITLMRNKNPNLKIIKYQCGNRPQFKFEKTFKEGDKPSWDRNHDETWIIPQQEYQNLEYYKTIYRHDDSQVKVVPFIWDPEPLIEHDKLLVNAGKKTPKYIPKARKEKKLSVMEPNLNVVKHSIIPLMIAENVFREYGNDAFDKIQIGSGKKLLKNSYYMEMVKLLDLVKANKDKIKYVSRYPISTFLAEGTDIVISHQWENPLNYAYLDAMYYGYPIVHNAEMVQDGGYFYKDFNISEGADQLKFALNEHDKNLDEYNTKNKPVLERYMSTNKKIVDTYRKLIDNVFNKDTHLMSYNYDWKTNLYK